ncbi:hypothetical protein ABBQ38_010270 [Trebouxia sp. C0009 RCD-2024]
MQKLVMATEDFVKVQIADLHHDASHDWSHIDRVRKMALVLAQEEGGADLEVVELAGLLHDIQDWKYSGSETAGAVTIQAFLQQCSCPPDKQEAVLNVIKGVGFKDELGSDNSRLALTPELAAVQDADRLDAIGAIGIARCFSFGGKFQQPLHDPTIPPREKLTKATYMDSSTKLTSINHFYEKLLKLQGLMKTEAGRKRAKQRHEFMQTYLQEFMLEWDAHA